LTKLSGDLDADFAFTGHFRHAKSGLHLALYRAYDADLGRWLSRDPLEKAETAEGPNLYGYVANNSVNYIDLNGKQTVLPVPAPPPVSAPPQLGPLALFVCTAEIVWHPKVQKALEDDLGPKLYNVCKAVYDFCAITDKTCQLVRERTISTPFGPATQCIYYCNTSGKLKYKEILTDKPEGVCKERELEELLKDY
jgi:RHS repeat-associated protein